MWSAFSQNIQQVKPCWEDRLTSLLTTIQMKAERNVIRWAPPRLIVCKDEPSSQILFLPSKAKRHTKGSFFFYVQIKFSGAEKDGGVRVIRKEWTFIEVALIGWIIWYFHVHKFPFIKLNFFCLFSNLTEGKLQKQWLNAYINCAFKCLQRWISKSKKEQK